MSSGELPADPVYEDDPPMDAILCELLRSGRFDGLRSGIVDKLRADGVFDRLREHAVAAAQLAMRRHELELRRSFLAPLGHVEDTKRQEVLSRVRAELYHSDLPRLLDTELRRVMSRGQAAQTMWTCLKEVYTELYGDRVDIAEDTAAGAGSNAPVEDDADTAHAEPDE